MTDFRTKLPSCRLVKLIYFRHIHGPWSGENHSNIARETSKLNVKEKLCRQVLVK
jgi:hypothetical protein